MKRNNFIFVLILTTFLFACSSSNKSQIEEVQQTQEPEVYIFDDVSEFSKKDSTEIKTEAPIIEKKYSYFLQIGAFSSISRAERFVSENKSKIDKTLTVTYNEALSLYTVQLPPFISKTEAENFRNELWKKNLFPDAFIVTAED